MYLHTRKNAYRFRRYCVGCGRWVATLRFPGEYEIRHLASVHVNVVTGRETWTCARCEGLVEA